jgi:hypothetical protein
VDLDVGRGLGVAREALGDDALDSHPATVADVVEAAESAE